jgi:hypothetical protein
MSLERLAQKLPYGGAILNVTADGTIHNGMVVVERFASRVEAIRALRRLGFERGLQGWKLRLEVIANEAT